MTQIAVIAYTPYSVVQSGWLSLKHWA